MEKSSQFGPLSKTQIYIEKTKGAIVGETKAVHVNIYVEKTKGEKDGPTLTNFLFRL